MAGSLPSIKAFGLDTEAKLDIDATELASTDAGKIAIQGGGADLIISDWLWVARQRAQGEKLTFYPHSSAIGAVMTKNPAINSVKDLAGKTLGVAGGPLDKSWLMLKAYALKNGVDLDKTATVLYGAPPLIAEKALQGEIDAALEFWNFAADLEAQGFTRAVELDRCREGARRQGRRRRHRLCLRRRFRGEEQGRAGAVLLDDEESQGADRDIGQGLGRSHAQRLGGKDAKTVDIYRKRYVAGAPKRSIAQEEADARTLYGALAALGGEKLVGPGKTLDPGTFYKGAEGKPH